MGKRNIRAVKELKKLLLGPNSLKSITKVEYKLLKRIY